MILIHFGLKTVAFGIINFCEKIKKCKLNAERKRKIKTKSSYEYRRARTLLDKKITIGALETYPDLRVA